MSDETAQARASFTAKSYILNFLVMSEFPILISTCSIRMNYSLVFLLLISVYSSSEDGLLCLVF